MSVTRAVAICALTVALLGLVWVELLARRKDSRIPTMSRVLGAVLTWRIGRLPIGRMAVLGFWCWLGWHFFAR